MTKENIVRVGCVAAIVAVAAFSRLVPHLPNAVPVVALALFAGAKIGSNTTGVQNGKTSALLIVFLSMFLSDLVIGFDVVSPFVYLALAGVVLLGSTVGPSNSVARILGGTLAGSLLFFFVTNFAVWLLQNLYPKSAAGLVQCYVMALPFFRNALVADLAFAALLFGAFALLEKTSRSVRVATGAVSA